MKVAVPGPFGSASDLMVWRLVQSCSMQMGRTLGRKDLSGREGEAVGSVDHPTEQPGQLGARQSWVLSLPPERAS